MAALSMSDESMRYVSLFLLIIVLLGVLNNLFMSIFERMYEFGVIQAIGTKARMVFRMIICEALWLAVFSIAIGVGVSFLIALVVNLNGIDYSGVEIGEVTFNHPIYYIPTLYQYTYYPALLMMFTVLASIYPAFHATKITLAEAMKKSL